LRGFLKASLNEFVLYIQEPGCNETDGIEVDQGMTGEVAQFDRTRDVLIALADAERAGPDELFNADIPLDPTVVEAAIHILDDAGVIEACCHADWN